MNVHTFFMMLCQKELFHSSVYGYGHLFSMQTYVFLSVILSFALRPFDWKFYPPNIRFSLFHLLIFCSFSLQNVRLQLGMFGAEPKHIVVLVSHFNACVNEIFSVIMCLCWFALSLMLHTFCVCSVHSMFVFVGQVIEGWGHTKICVYSFDCHSLGNSIANGNAHTCCTC